MSGHEKPSTVTDDVHDGTLTESDAPESISTVLANAATRGIDHVAIAVHDPDAAATWFAHRFGFVTVHDQVVEGTVNVRLMFLAATDDRQDTTIQLVSPVGDGPVARHLATNGEGLHHVCLIVDNVAETLDVLEEPDTPTFIGGYDVVCAFLRQSVPGSVNIELAEPRPDPVAAVAQAATAASAGAVNRVGDPSPRR